MDRVCRLVREPVSALDTALRFLASRPRSAYEIRTRLARAGFEAETVGAVLDQLRGHGVVDDQAFAAYWVEQRQTFRPRGARLVRAELARLGVARTEADSATTVLEDTAEEDAYRAAGRRAQRLREASAEVFASRLSGFLARRGFDWDTISKVVGRLERERNPDPESDRAPR